MHDRSPAGTDEKLAQMELQLHEVTSALGLLGLRQCSRCRKFLRVAEPGALFDAGEPVCYQCVHAWWIDKSAQLQGSDRATLEHKLVHWLIHQHHAKVIKQASKAIESTPGLRLVAGCIECRGLGKDLGGAPCSHCNGGGTVWIVFADKAN